MDMMGQGGHKCVMEESMKWRDPRVIERWKRLCRRPVFYARYHAAWSYRLHQFHAVWPD
jgi:hypothetical protein